MSQSPPSEKPPHMTQDEKWLAIDDYMVESFLEDDPALGTLDRDACWRLATEVKDPHGLLPGGN